MTTFTDRLERQRWLAVYGRLAMMVTAAVVLPAVPIVGGGILSAWRELAVQDGAIKTNAGEISAAKLRLDQLATGQAQLNSALAELAKSQAVLTNSTNNLADVVEERNGNLKELISETAKDIDTLDARVDRLQMVIPAPPFHGTDGN